MIRKSIEEAVPAEEYLAEQVEALDKKLDDACLSSLRSLSLEYAASQASQLNYNELKSIVSLIAYAAYDKDVSEDTIKALVEAHYNVDDVKKIQSRDYEDVVHYLLGLNVKEAIN